MPDPETSDFDTTEPETTEVEVPGEDRTDSEPPVAKDGKLSAGTIVAITLAVAALLIVIVAVLIPLYNRIKK